MERADFFITNLRPRAYEVVRGMKSLDNRSHVQRVQTALSGKVEAALRQRFGEERFERVVTFRWAEGPEVGEFGSLDGSVFEAKIIPTCLTSYRWSQSPPHIVLSLTVYYYAHGAAPAYPLEQRLEAFSAGPGKQWVEESDARGLRTEFTQDLEPGHSVAHVRATTEYGIVFEKYDADEGIPHCLEKMVAELQAVLDLL